VSGDDAVHVLVVGLANGLRDANDGRWLVDCDVDGAGGRGIIRTTPERALASEFADAGEAMTYWRRQSRAKPLRPDGKPNRPLTAYTIEIVRTGVEPLATILRRAS